MANEAMPHGGRYDVVLCFERAKQLPQKDIFGGSAYVVAKVITPGGLTLDWRSHVVKHSKCPRWSRSCTLVNIPPGCIISVEVWSKRLTRNDTLLGATSHVFTPERPPTGPALPCGSLRSEDAISGHAPHLRFTYTSTPGASWRPGRTGPTPDASWDQPFSTHGEGAEGQAAQERPLGEEVGWMAPLTQGQHASSGHRDLKSPLLHEASNAWPSSTGTLWWSLSWSPSAGAGYPAVREPVRYSQSLSPLAGVMMGLVQNDDILMYSSYKVFLNEVDATFGDFVCHWNTAYDKAQQIFQNPLLVSSLSTAHVALYSTTPLMCKCEAQEGTLSTADDLFRLLKFGMRRGERRFFTYVLLGGSLRFSETGAAFFSDFLSKHALHSGAAEEVLYAGEFLIWPDADAEGGHKLMVDNNSGTYAPPAKELPRMARLLCANFPGLVVETLDRKDPRLEWYHSQVPSRQAPSSATPSHPGSSAASTATEAARTPPPAESRGSSRQQQYMDGTSTSATAYTSSSVGASADGGDTSGHVSQQVGWGELGGPPPLAVEACSTGGMLEPAAAPAFLGHLHGAAAVDASLAPASTMPPAGAAGLWSAAHGPARGVNGSAEEPGWL